MLIIHKGLFQGRKGDTYHKRGGRGSDDRIDITFRMDDFHDRCTSPDFETYTDRFASSRASNPLSDRPERLGIDEFTVG